ncbi:MAG: endo-1,4-D-glucanase [Gallionellales bacterium RIFOXYD12_FULL_53_10]|nr:MAG: endo-1,4-D-glucanase [Gallionellales bacterium GWA2_54_124]OGT20718.1 MAG: endo-1,4-D-glucanase [Gallionellales bacterium RIFOXYD12_FULL_53_10]
MVALPADAQTCWPAWQSFGSRFIQADGRVLADESEQRYSTSEGQAYSLFFALIADDRPRFEKILLWTRDNLAGGDLSARLPAWQWGKRADGTWGVVDQNSASDADTWFAYTLLEAGRLWREPRYTALGRLMLANIRIQLVRNLPGAGNVLLPAANGFALESGGVRLNPSYIPIQLFRAFSVVDPEGPWVQIIDNNLAMLHRLAVMGYVSDWAAYVPGRGYLTDPLRGAIGTHDAIRVYLWWGMLSRQDPAFGGLKKLIYGMNKLIPKYQVTPPLMVDTQTGDVSGMSPPSFSAALLPYFKTMKNSVAVKLQSDRLISKTEGDLLVGEDIRYYDQVLALFGQGWMERRFAFSLQGQLVVQWKPSCSAIK